MPATTKSKSESSRALTMGLSVNSLPINPTLAAPIGPAKGRPESVNAADAPINEGISESISGSSDITVAIT